VHIFHHHNGIIHHQADGHDQGKQGDGIGIVSQGHEYGKGTDQGDRDGHGRDQGGPPVLEKSKNYGNYQQGHQRQG